MVRATWLIKMTCAYYSAISEAKIKKRQAPDPNLGKWGSVRYVYLPVDPSSGCPLHPLRTQHPSWWALRKSGVQLTATLSSLNKSCWCPHDFARVDLCTTQQWRCWSDHHLLSGPKHLPTAFPAWFYSNLAGLTGVGYPLLPWAHHCLVSGQ